MLIAQFASQAHAIYSETETDTNEEVVVWEVKGGKRTKLVSDDLADMFIVPRVNWAFSSESKTSTVVSFGNVVPSVWVQCRELFMRLMLPEGYPESVTSDYMEYSLWRGVQGVAAQVSSVLATQGRAKQTPLICHIGSYGTALCHGENGSAGHMGRIRGNLDGPRDAFDRQRNDCLTTNTIQTSVWALRHGEIGHTGL